MTDAEILDRLTTIFRSVFASDQIVLTAETTAKDIAKWDSFHFVDIIVRIEETFGIKIRARDANKTKNVGDIVSLIRTKLA